MPKPRLITSAPLSLSGSVGPRGQNRPADVALIQALLGLKRNRRGQAYLPGRVSGRFDTQTAVALAQFRLDNNDPDPKRALPAHDAMLQRLAQGNRFAVVEGTTTPYKLNPSAGAGNIGGPQAKGLTADSQRKLRQLLQEVGRDYGISFSVYVDSALGSPHILAGFFTPNNLILQNGRGSGQHVSSIRVLQNVARPLFQILSADIRARCDRTLAIKDPEDRRSNDMLKNKLACVVRSEVDGIEAWLHEMLRLGKRSQAKLAVKFLERYLDRTGRDIIVTRDDALAYKVVRDAAETNIERFKTLNFPNPKRSNPAFAAVERLSRSASGTETVSDHWKVDITHPVSTSIGRLVKNIPNSIVKGGIPGLGKDFGLNVNIGAGAGRSHITSTGKFSLLRKGDRITVKGIVTHVWTDEGYNFDIGKFFGADSKKLEHAHRATRFDLWATWKDRIEGEMAVGNFTVGGGIPLIPPGTPPSKSLLRRRWLRFKVKPN